MGNTNDNRYTRIIEDIFNKFYKDGNNEVAFSREDITESAKKLNVVLPKNLGDIIYSFRYRTVLPQRILKVAPKGYQWIIRPAGRSKYKFVLVKFAEIIPSQTLAETKILDATPGIIERYAQNDEQALLAKIRYNRLIDIFTGLTCYSLQNHFRTSVPKIGQIEIDEIYIGIDKKGAHYILPVQAKGEKDKLGIVQTEQDFALCEYKFANLIPLPISAQFVSHNVISMFQLEQTESGIAIASEKHYKLVPTKDLDDNEILRYQSRLE